MIFASIVSLASLIATVSSASCDCKWRVFYREPIKTNEISISVDPYHPQFQADLECDKRQSLNCSGPFMSLSQTNLQAYEVEKKGTNICSISMRLPGLLDYSGNTSSLYLSAQPNGCPNVERNLTLKTSNPKNYINTVMLLNGKVWTVEKWEQREKAITFKPNEVGNFTLTAFNPKDVNANITITRMTSVKDKWEKYFTVDNQPQWSDAPANARLIKNNSTSISIAGLTGNFGLSVWIFDGISGRKYYSIRFNVDSSKGSTVAMINTCMSVIVLLVMSLLI